MRLPAFWGALAVAAGLGTGVGPARAQTAAELAQARSHFREALSQEAAGDWAGALAKLESVARVKLTPQVRFHIARCKEHLGRYTEALGDYKLAEYEAGQAGAKELAEIAEARAALEQRVPTVTVIVPSDMAGASVELDGVELGAPQLGVPFPVNPGAHRLVAKRGARRVVKSFTVADGEAPKLELAAPPPDEAGARSEPSTAPGELGDEPAKDPARASGAGPWPWVAAGVGAAGFIGAGVFYALHSSAESDLSSACRGSVCPESMQDTQDSSKLYGTLSGVSLGLGVAGAATATVLFLTGSSKPAEQTARARVMLQPAVGPSSGGVRLFGAF
ncbi:MAG: hypothetical protein OZ928_09620 [Polyangiaceae bacterium]|nr:hypothetical protein [Polyangiaceae bacterium]